MNPSLQVVSLFSGGMGLDLGFMRRGLSTVLSQDIDRHCVSTMRANCTHSVIQGCIRTMLAADPTGGFLCEASGLSRGEAFAVIGGPPCQSFSNAGRRKGVEDVRGTLFNEFCHAIDVLRPRFFAMENVPAIASKSMPGVLDQILSRFAELGYGTVHGVLDASDFGSPQKRRRLVVLGARDGEQVDLPRPTHGAGLAPKVTVRNAIGDLRSNPGDGLRFSARTLRFIGMVPAGGNWRDLPEDLQREALGKAYESEGGRSGFMRRLPWDGYSPTLVTSPVGRMSLLAHPEADRPLSVREYARLQGFPDDWMVMGPLGARYRQIGNAVAVPMAEAVAQALLDASGTGYGLLPLVA